MINRLIALFVIFTSITNAQKSNDLAIYIDSTHTICKESNYTYIRIIKDYYLEKVDYSFAEYYKSGKIALKGTTKDKNALKLIGTAVSFYENGNKKEISNYLDSHLNGKQFGWYENGSSEFEKEFIFDKKNNTIIEKIVQHWDENNIQDVVNGNGFYKKSIENRTNNSNTANAFSENGEIRNGLRHGIWTGKSKQLKIDYREIYNEGILINGVSTDENHIEHPYTVISIKPSPKKGLDNFYKYIGLNFTVPRIVPSYERPLNASLKGRILISFVINENGNIIEPQIIQDIGYGSGDEAIRILKKTGDWIPGEIRGIKTKVSYTLPITINN
ncbi:MAG: hypothetical protein RLZZ44_453 [Bacteroidota bacterium]|jgi:antitoxin component YwqK of YwqJK toxin-antitoxin module